MRRSEAKSLELKRYFTGKPCKAGHVCERLTSNGSCYECHKVRRRAFYAENIDDQRSARRAYFAANREKSLAAARARYADDPEKAKSHHRKWRNKNLPRAREIKRALQAKNRALRIAVDGHYNADDVAEIRRLQKDRCAYCRCKLHGRGEVDHITPVSNGGTNWPKNLQLLCKTCNRSKHNSDPIEYARRLGKLV